MTSPRLVLFLVLAAFGAFFGAVPSALGDKKSDAVVRVTANASKPDAEGNQSVVVALAIDPGWHTYANPLPKNFPGVPTTVTVESKSRPDVKVDYPRGKAQHDESFGAFGVYEDRVEIAVKVRRVKSDTGPLTLNVRLMACESKENGKCLVPATIKLSVP